VKCLFVLSFIVLFVSQETHGGLLYSIDFENEQIGHSLADQERVAGQTGQKDDYGRAESVAGGGAVPGGVETIVENPQKDENNTSEKTLFCQTPSNYHRAEFSSPRFPTVEKTYVYQWSYFMPNDFYNDCSIFYIFMADWKTWPCSDGDGWGAEICGGGGIYNDVQLNGQKFTWPFRWRAEPDCKEQNFTFELGKWYSFQEEIKWTNTKNGYQRLWMNGKLVREDKNIKTLLDRFNAGGCDIYWSLGFYGVWNGNKALSGVYIDNLKIYDTSGVQGIIGRENGVRNAAKEFPLGNGSFRLVNQQGAGKADLRTTVKNACRVSVSLYTAQGAWVKRSVTNTLLTAGEYTIPISLVGLAAGLYILNISSARENLVRPLMVY
jgi:hypothetical protein